MEEPKAKNKPVQKPRRSGGQMLVVALLSVGVGILGTLYAQDLIEVITPVALTVLLTLFAVGVLLYLVITFYRDKIIHYLFGEAVDFDSALGDAQDMVRQTIIGTTEAIPGLDPSKKKQLQQAAPRMANYLIWSRFRSQGLRMMVGFMVAIGGLATTILLFNQNKLLEKQNEKIDMQMSLEESNRRSAMMNQMTNVLDKIDEEVRDTFNTNHGSRGLSQQLIGRIASLSEGLKPYRYLDGDSLSRPLSPERGQLLLALINSGLDTVTLYEIFQRTTFQQADLRRVKLANVDLKEINLVGANLDETTCLNVNFSEAKLVGASFIRASFSHVSLSRADLRMANLYKLNMPRKPIAEDKYGDLSALVTSALKKADLDSSFSYLGLAFPVRLAVIRSRRLLDLTDAHLTSANLKDADFSSANLTRSKLVGCNLTNTNLSYADLTSAVLIGAELKETDLAGARLTDTDLHFANLTSVNFARASLEASMFDYASISCPEALEVDSLLQVYTLFQSTGLSASMKDSLLRRKPSLFDKPQLGFFHHMNRTTFLDDPIFPRISRMPTRRN